MKKNIQLSILLLFVGIFTLKAQKDPILFTIDGNPVHVSEFKYIYDKTNGDNADYSRASLEEYLDLYTNFKLKVQRAKALQLDTIPSLQQELAGYRKQLANTYLMDRQVLESLIKEAYDRLQYDVSISHIMFSIPSNPTQEDLDASYKRALEVKKLIENGASFDEMAVEHSDDPSAKENKGYIGYIQALQLRGFYPVETAAFQTSVGQVSNPVKSSLGYHLVLVNDKRPARGELEAAHILLRVPDPSKEAESQAQINKIYKELQDGGDFRKIAKEYSQDENTARAGGYIGFFGINKYELVFEETAFALENDGDFTRPFHSSVGWHIVQRISRPEMGDYEQLKKRLKIKVKNDSRYNIAKEELVKKIKKEANFVEKSEGKQAMLSQLDKSFLTYKWNLPKENLDQELFRLINTVYTTGDFAAYLAKNGGARVRDGRNASVEYVYNKMYDAFVNQKCIEFEEGRLETKYPEFKSLMREYEEGILLFEATKTLVWDKASQDTVGLESFYQKNKKNYSWDKRVKATIYTLPIDNDELINTVQSYAKKMTPEQILKKVADGEKLIKYKEGTFEKGQNGDVDKVEWKKNTVGDVRIQDKEAYFVKIEEVYKPRSKTLNEARGYVVADYQDFLEKSWINELKKEYKVKVNAKVFDGLVK